MTEDLTPGTPSPFEQIRRTVCVNSSQRLNDHIVGSNDMITKGKNPQPTSILDLRACPAIAVATAVV